MDPETSHRATQIDTAPNFIDTHSTLHGTLQDTDNNTTDTHTTHFRTQSEPPDPPKCPVALLLCSNGRGFRWSALNTSQGADLDTNSLPQIVRVPIKNNP